jgi:pimeloyl-ACP methyl ester carboxylesterase
MKVNVRGRGRALVYLHPAGGLRWTRFLNEISKSRAVHMPTFPGFDGTPTEEGLHSRRDLARLVAEYIDGVGKPLDVMGCSFGGAVALWLAIERPDCVDHLVLESPGGLQSIDRAYPEKIDFEEKAEEIQAQNRSMLARYGAEDGIDPELHQNLDKVQAVTLILSGTEDRIVGKESVQLLKSRLRHAFLVYVWDAAHNIEVDQPGRMLALVQSFLERSDAFVVNYA